MVKMFIIIIFYYRMGRGKKKSKTPKESQELHKVAKKPGKGVRLTSQSQNIIENVRLFFEKERVCRSTIRRTNVVERTAQATGVSKTTVKKIHKEYLSLEGQLLTPMKRYAISWG